MNKFKAINALILCIILSFGQKTSNQTIFRSFRSLNWSYWLKFIVWTPPDLVYTSPNCLNLTLFFCLFEFTAFFWCRISLMTFLLIVVRIFITRIRASHWRKRIKRSKLTNQCFNYCVLFKFNIVNQVSPKRQQENTVFSTVISPEHQ